MPYLVASVAVDTKTHDVAIQSMQRCLRIVSKFGPSGTVSLSLRVGVEMSFCIEEVCVHQAGEQEPNVQHGGYGMSHARRR